MPTAQIKINGTDARFATVTIGVAVNLSNHDTGGETTYSWSIVDQPEGTGDSLSSTSVRDVAFTPTKEGSYELQLTVNSLLIQTAVVAVLDARTHERVPAATETVEAGSSQGWALAVKRILNRTLHASVDANLVVAVSPGSIGAGTIVSLTGVSTINSGTQASFKAPGIVAALGTAAHSNALGVLIDGVVPGSIGAGALVLVRMFGLVPTSASGSPSVGATVFLSNTATPALTPGTVSRAIGYVVAASGGSYQWVVDGGVDAELAAAAFSSFSTMAATSIKANITGSTAAGADATPAQIRTMLGGNYLGRLILTGSGSSTLPAGTSVVRFLLIGQGGGGGGAVAAAVGAGGSSGALLNREVGTPGVPLSSSFSWAMGSAGGGGGSAAGGNGAAGSDSTFTVNSTTFTAKGGGGGIGVPSGAAINSAISAAPAAGTSSGGYVSFGYGGSAFGDPGVTGFTGQGGGTELGAGGAPVTVGAGKNGDTGGFGGGGSGGQGGNVGGNGQVGGCVAEFWS